MPATTYLGEHEATQPTGDADIDELLTEVREVTGEDWRCERFEFDVGLLWWSKRRQIFTLYKRVDTARLGSGEYQIINFAPDVVGGWSINHEAQRSRIIAYLHGMLGGLETAKHEWFPRDLVFDWRRKMDGVPVGSGAYEVACDMDRRLRGGKRRS
jgi:hypothetical protein